VRGNAPDTGLPPSAIRRTMTNLPSANNASRVSPPDGRLESCPFGSRRAPVLHGPSCQFRVIHTRRIRILQFMSVRMQTDRLAWQNHFLSHNRASRDAGRLAALSRSPIRRPCSRVLQISRHRHVFPPRRPSATAPAASLGRFTGRPFRSHRNGWAWMLLHPSPHKTPDPRRIVPVSFSARLLCKGMEACWRRCR